MICRHRQARTKQLNTYLNKQKQNIEILTKLPINYILCYILGGFKNRYKMEVPKIIEREDKFCESIDCERTEDTKQFIYDSRNNKSAMNLPYVLLEYKQWLIYQGFIKELK